MGTNFYLRRTVPTIRETVHLCKRSMGWRTVWQATDEADWPRWCDRTAMASSLPHPIRSVDDAVELLFSGEWELVDENGEVYPDWGKQIHALVNIFPGGLDHVRECGEGYHDEGGNTFVEGGFS